MNEAAAFPVLQFLCSVPRRPPRKAANPETCDSRTCAGSLLLELTLLLSACSSSSCPRALPPFLSRLDWHCTSVRRPGERSDGVDPCLRAERTTSPAPPPACRLHSASIPTARHFLSRQSWHFLLMYMSISQPPPLLQWYTAFFVTLRRKKPKESG